MQLLEAGKRRVSEHCEDVRSIFRAERGGRPSAYRCLQERLGRTFRTVALQPLCEFNDQVVVQRNPGKPHTDEGSGGCWGGIRGVVALDVPDRDAILRVLEKCPDVLLELRATLLPERVWLLRGGLA